MHLRASTVPKENQGPRNRGLDYSEGDGSQRGTLGGRWGWVGLNGLLMGFVANWVGCVVGWVTLHLLNANWGFAACFITDGYHASMGS